MFFVLKIIFAISPIILITGCNNPFSEKSLVEGGFAPPKLNEESPAAIPDATPTPSPTPTSAPTPTPTPLTITFGNINDITTFGMSTNASANVAFSISGSSSITCSSTYFAGSTSTGVSLTFSGTNPSCRVAVPIVGGYTGSVVVTIQTVSPIPIVSKSFTINVLPAAQVAYSLRQVVRGYTGSAIRVCLTSTCTSQTDIGFDSNGDLDQSALSSFCGASSCFVRTWYDQSGNSRDAVQTTNAYQPLIFTSGATTISNGKPTIRSDGSDDFLMHTGFSYSYSAFNSVWRWNSTITQSYGGLIGQRTSSTKVPNSDSSFVLVAGSAGAINQTNISEAATTATAAWINSTAVPSLSDFNNGNFGTPYGTNLGILSLTRSATPSGLKELTIAADSNPGVGSRHGAMDISELFFLSSLSTSDRNLLESDQRSYYATP